MSRLDGKFTASGDMPLDLAELLAALEAHPDRNTQGWRDAIACYLSVSDGWRDASQQLGGAFVNEDAEPGLSRNKEP